MTLTPAELGPDSLKPSRGTGPTMRGERQLRHIMASGRELRAGENQRGVRVSRPRGIDEGNRRPSCAFGGACGSQCADV